MIAKAIPFSLGLVSSDRIGYSYPFQQIKGLSSSIESKSNLINKLKFLNSFEAFQLAHSVKKIEIQLPDLRKVVVSREKPGFQVFALSVSLVSPRLEFVILDIPGQVVDLSL